MRRIKKLIFETWIDSYQNNGFFKKYISILGVDVLVKASNFLLIPFYLRLMSQDEYGLYNYLIYIIQALGLVLTLGLYIPQSKLYHSMESERERGKMLFTIGVTLTLLIILLAVPVVLFNFDYWVADLLFKHDVPYGKYRDTVLLSFLVAILSVMLTYFLFTSERLRQLNGYNLGRIFSIVLTLFALYLIKGDTVQIRLGFTYTVEFIIVCVFGYYFVKETVPVFSYNIMVRSLKMGLPVMLTGLFAIIVNLSDKFFLEKYGSFKDLSNYFLAYSFASIIPLIFSPLQNIWMPLFLKEKDVQKNAAKTKRLIANLVVFFLLLSAGIWIFFKSLFWVEVIPVKYEEVAFILPILLVTQVFTALSSLLSNYLIYFEKTYLILITGAVISILNIGTAIWLIPIWGIYGAALTTLISNLCFFIVYNYMAQILKKRYVHKQPAYAN